MAKIKLIADSGATKAEWCLLKNDKKKIIFTQGISPYFLNLQQIIDVLRKELFPRVRKSPPAEIHFYGTGLGNPSNVKIIRAALRALFPKASLEIKNDLLAAARALCGRKKGIACILGTGSNSCYYDGKRIVKNSPGLGYVLGDEASGAYLGKKVIQYYLYGTFDEELKGRFEQTFKTDKLEILDSVYKKPLPNRYLASFAIFLASNRGHYMVENIIEDALNEFFVNHIFRYKESWLYPLNFVGGVAWGFRDVIKEVCAFYELQAGTILKNPMEGLIKYHS